MRSLTTAAKVHRLLAELGRAARGPGRVYLTGGTSAVLIGWRQSTIDVDLKLDPEPTGIFEAIARLKRELDINIELASPDDFMPALPGWQDRSPSIVRHGAVSFFHYDFHAQALAKIERGHTQDLADVHAMLARDLVTRDRLRQLFKQIEHLLIRYPAIDPVGLARRLDQFLGHTDG